MVNLEEQLCKSSVYGIGIVDAKYPTCINSKPLKEYRAWSGMLERCFAKRGYHRWETYENITCCNEWLYYPNFYEWLHSQENFEKWLNGDKWCLDKDILVKGNKVYSPDTCCLVPQNVNQIFKKRRNREGLPIGVSHTKNKNKYIAQSRNEYLGRYSTLEEAFLAYKKTKEEHIKKVAQEEYSKGNITEKCYEAMMNHKVEITD